MPNQLPADALPLMSRQNGHRRQRHGHNGSAAGVNPHPAEQDVADDSSLNLSDERLEDDAFGTQAVYQVGFIGSAKGCFVDRADLSSLVHFAIFTTYD